MTVLSIIVGGVGFGFAILAVVMVIVSVVRGKHALSGQIVPLQQLHEMFNPGQQNMIEIVEEKRDLRNDSGEGDKKAGKPGAV